MSKLLPFQGLLLNLSGKIRPQLRREYLTKDRAYELLKEWTGQDFGYDVKKWSSWIAKNRKKLYPGRKLGGNR